MPEVRCSSHDCLTALRAFAQAGALLRRAAATKWRPRPWPRAEGMRGAGGAVMVLRSPPHGACPRAQGSRRARPPARPLLGVVNPAVPGGALLPARRQLLLAVRVLQPRVLQCRHWAGGSPAAPHGSARPPSWQREPSERPIPAGPANGAAQRPASTMGDVVRGRRAVTGVTGAPLSPAPPSPCHDCGGDCG